MIHVKICGLTRQQDAELAAELGASALGFVFEPTSPRCIDAGHVDLNWIGSLAPYVATVAVYGISRPNPDSRLFTAVQSVHWQAEPEPWQRRIHAVRPDHKGVAELLAAVPDDAVAIVLDAYSSSGYGGTGKTLDWGFAADVVQASKKPVILAGGLNPENVAQAVRQVKPYGVDVSSGTEAAPGSKDAEKLKAFLGNALSA